ncbi:MAG: MAPEG family protein [Xanthobacteraceae bacterium]|nr:MAG: MAPEG family protein [Xanthobacteraceae bacterium]
MSVRAVLLPLFALIVLTFILLFRMGLARVAAVRSGEARVWDTALGQPNWPEKPTQFANSYANQFQIPLLYFILVALALPLRKTDLLFVILSWLFVALRYAHAYIHITTNHVPRRFGVFVAGVVVLMVMWALFAANVLLGL